MSGPARRRRRGSAHTPGPWCWDGDTLMPCEGHPDRQAVHSILQREGGYGFLMSKTADTLAELQADYRLIAAAPLLLRALQRLQGVCVGMDAEQAGPRRPPSEAQYQRALRLAAQAIAAATQEPAAPAQGCDFTFELPGGDE